MLRRVLAALWRIAPKKMRRWSVRLVEPRFTVSAGGVVLDEEGRVLLLEHVYRAGNGWGVPGGFVERGEQPDDALRRELREEVGLELDSVEVAFVRLLKRSSHLEIIFRCRAQGHADPRSREIKSASWFALDALPRDLDQDQHHLIERALSNGAKMSD
ncbi:MAG TPA: NUDIX domain-containing protein [Pyrinomonadaceae bacterium]|jgi:ADP-ribose pyrophosphatase YjhB (NUDIX family)